jgi:hypothetical protein
MTPAVFRGGTVLILDINCPTDRIQYWQGFAANRFGPVFLPDFRG